MFQSLYNKDAEWTTNTEGRFIFTSYVATQQLANNFWASSCPSSQQTDIALQHFSKHIILPELRYRVLRGLQKILPIIWFYPLYPISSPYTSEELLSILV